MIPAQSPSLQSVALRKLFTVLEIPHVEIFIKFPNGEIKPIAHITVKSTPRVVGKHVNIIPVYINKTIIAP
jgi:hypothetical protein